MKRAILTFFFTALLTAVTAVAIAETPNPGVKSGRGNKAEVDFLCVDGVEYLAFMMNVNGSSSISITPHIKADGSAYTCEQPSPKPDSSKNKVFG